MELKVVSPKYGTFNILIDDEDYISTISNCYISNCGGYFYARINPSKAALHRLIVGDIPKGMVVDHINGNTLDNRKNNLRITTRTENNINKHKLSSKNRTGSIGVSINKTYGFTAQIQVGGKKIHLGSFKNIVDATKARKEAELKFWGRELSI